jgi:hypothetical protein
MYESVHHYVQSANIVCGTISLLIVGVGFQKPVAEPGTAGFGVSAASRGPTPQGRSQFIPDTPSASSAQSCPENSARVSLRIGGVSLRPSQNRG